MKVKLHRKQALLIGLAIVLAFASYWIPAPQQTPSEQTTRELPKPTVGSRATESITVAREPALTERFSITAQLEQPLTVSSTLERRPLLFSWIGRQEVTSAQVPTSQFFSPGDIATSEAMRSDPVLMLPIRNFPLPDNR